MLSLDRVGRRLGRPRRRGRGPTPVAAGPCRRPRPACRLAPETGQRSSDHWSFVRAGLPGLRVGSTPYAGYHSAADVPSVVDPAQLERTGRLVLSWLSG